MRAALGAVGMALGLPRATTRYTVNRVRDPDARRRRAGGRPLRAGNVRRPPAPCWSAGPYGRTFPFSLAFARLYAARGYHVVLQSVRGTFGSAGEFEPMVNEAADGADTVAWLREQPWFTGTVRHHRAVLSGFHPVGAAERSAAGAGRGRHHRGAARLQSLDVGHRLVRGQRLPGLERSGCPTRRTPGASVPESASCGLRARLRARSVRCRWVPRPGRCSARARPGSNRGSNTPTPTTRSGTGCASPPHWTASRCRCCCSAAGRTSSCARRCSSTGTCATGAWTSR